MPFSKELNISIFGTAKCNIIDLRVLAETDTSNADPTATKKRKIFHAASSAPRGVLINCRLCCKWVVVRKIVVRKVVVRKVIVRKVVVRGNI